MISSLLLSRSFKFIFPVIWKVFFLSQICLEDMTFIYQILNDSSSKSLIHLFIHSVYNESIQCTLHSLSLSTHTVIKFCLTIISFTHEMTKFTFWVLQALSYTFLYRFMNSFHSFKDSRHPLSILVYFFLALISIKENLKNSWIPDTIHQL